MAIWKHYEIILRKTHNFTRLVWGIKRNPANSPLSTNILVKCTNLYKEQRRVKIAALRLMVRHKYLKLEVRLDNSINKSVQIFWPDAAFSLIGGTPWEKFARQIAKLQQSVGASERPKGARATLELPRHLSTQSETLLENAPVTTF